MFARDLGGVAPFRACLGVAIVGSVVMRRFSQTLVVFGVLSSCTSDTGSGSPTMTSGDESTAGETVIAPSSDGSSSTATDDVSGSTSSSGVVTSSSSGAPAPEGPPVCTRDCEFPSDCCRADDPDCPSATYPGNYGCVNGACVPPACRSDEECARVSPGTSCREVFGHPQCVALCDDVTPCEGDDMACMGQTDDGDGYCRESCVDNGVLACPTTTCDEATGLCLCELGDCPTGEICAPL